MKEYTIGEIYRLQLIKTASGEPYKDKASVSKVLSRYPHTVKKTAFGPAKMYSEATIKQVNKRFS